MTEPDDPDQDPLEFGDPLLSEREYSDEMHRQNDPHYFPSEPRRCNDDGDFESDDCPFCEGAEGGCIECDFTGLYNPDPSYDPDSEDE